MTHEGSSRCMEGQSMHASAKIKIHSYVEIYRVYSYCISLVFPLIIYQGCFLCSTPQQPYQLEHFTIQCYHSTDSCVPIYRQSCPKMKQNILSTQHLHCTKQYIPVTTHPSIPFSISSPSCLTLTSSQARVGGDKGRHMRRAQEHVRGRQERQE